MTAISLPAKAKRKKERKVANKNTICPKTLSGKHEWVKKVDWYSYPPEAGDPWIECAYCGMVKDI